MAVVVGVVGMAVDSLNGLVCKILCSPIKPCKGIFLSQVVCIII